MAKHGRLIVCSTCKWGLIKPAGGLGPRSFDHHPVLYSVSSQLRLHDLMSADKNLFYQTGVRM